MVLHEKSQILNFSNQILIWDGSQTSSPSPPINSWWILLHFILSSWTFGQLWITDLIQSCCSRKSVITVYLPELWIILFRIGIDVKMDICWNSKQTLKSFILCSFSLSWNSHCSQFRDRMNAERNNDKCECWDRWYNSLCSVALNGGQWTWGRVRWNQHRIDHLSNFYYPKRRKILITMQSMEWDSIMTDAISDE
jgi:hypothetical protein